MVIYATYALYRQGYLFQKVTLTEIFKTSRFVCIAGQGGGTPGGGGTPQEGAAQLSPAVCLGTRRKVKGTCTPPISLPANKAAAGQK